MPVSPYRLVSALVLSCAPVLALADAVVVVPGKNAGYIYSAGRGGVAEEDKRISVAVFKLGEFTGYRIESEPPGFVCDTNCSERAAKVPGGTIALKIVGNVPVPGVNIPLRGRWQAPCADTTSDTAFCELNLTALNAQVRVTVSPDLEVGTVLDLPGGGEAMFVSIDSTHRFVTVAGHQSFQANPEPWLTVAQRVDTSLGLTSSTDGPGNTGILVGAGSAAASYCRSLGPEWYLPARNELNTLTSAARARIPSYRDSWSSTEYDFTAKPNSSSPEWKYKAYIRGDDKTAYEYKLKNGKVDKNSTSTAPVLCFRRLSF